MHKRRTPTIATTFIQSTASMCGLLMSLSACHAQSSTPPAAEAPGDISALRTLFMAMPVRNRLWVDADATGPATGTSQAPFPTISQAVAAARPGTAIMVRAGLYRENILFPKGKTGLRDAPILLLSADGPQAAHIVAADPAKPTIGGGGTDYVAVAGFLVTGGHNGIQFSQNGYGFTDTVSHILIRSNRIEKAVQDGVKVNGGEQVEVSNNVIYGGTDEGIDYFAIVHGLIANNEVSRIHSPTGGISVKGGSDDLLIRGNHVHDIQSDGILVGGWSSPKIRPRPGYADFEARNIRVENNRVERIGKRPLNFMAAIDSEATGNFLSGNPAYYTVIQVARNAPMAPAALYSRNLTFSDNVIFRGDRQLKTEPGSGTIRFERNRTGTQWRGQAGADLARYSADSPFR